MKKMDRLKIFQEEFESNFNDYRDEREEKKEKFINEKLSELPNHKFLQQLSLNVSLWGFDAVILYPSALSGKDSIYPRTETEYPMRKI